MAESAHVSPLAPAEWPELPPIKGVALASVEAGIMYRGRPDVLLCVMDEGTQVAGVFTKSLTASAPVDLCRANLAGGTARALIVNAGNANAFTGKAGVTSVKQTAAGVAKATGCRADEVFIASTGVIGESLDAGKITSVLGVLSDRLDENAWQDAASAIMTTDTFPKAATASARLDGKKITLNGIAKGSGMIAPDMATMLSFVFTDAALPAPVLQTLLQQATDRSFNNITVDSDTSTSDTLMLFASGASEAGSDIQDPADPRLKAFSKALNTLLLDLAHQVVRDGEGAEKFVSVEIQGAESDAAARRIGLAIANSPLVKTAIAGEDANWGRVVMAVGKSGERAERDKLKIWIGGVRVAIKGQRDPDYREEMVTGHMASRDVVLKVDVGVGKGKATVWTCDLTHRYIDINADYRS
ncbi:MAG: bifunctional glutamate N-acetyltransferase/amino-acid acetyltransferase ArgJ [Alphaproteobacteria bacterium]|nr:bifunctional glutamate N-acetyltransferase/amino-acid acetyltransferase ArgJ [Alphaproteobacteria bacterium]